MLIKPAVNEERFAQRTMRDEKGFLLSTIERAINDYCDEHSDLGSELNLFFLA